MLSNRTLGNIKFQSNKGHLLAWLKQERVFVEANSLGINRPVTIGYFTKIALDITNLSNFRDHLINQLMLIDLDADTAVELAPHLKDAQLNAMMNGDEYVPILPNFEVYRMRISHGCAPLQVQMDVIGIKGAPQDAKLLGEFFTCLAAENSTDDRDGKFIPKGAAYLLGPQTYEHVLKENNFFLMNMVTIPINLEFDAWFAVINPNQTSETKPISIHAHLLCQPWFLHIESVAKKKCYVVTTRSNLPKVRAWIDTNLEPMIRKSIPPGLDPPASLLPRHLDKPVYSATSRTYAEILKTQFSLAPAATMTTTDNNRPPRKRQASIIDYDSDKSTDYPSLSSMETNSTIISNGNLQPATTTPLAITQAYATELKSLKDEIAQLKTIITTAVEQILQAMVSLHTTPPSSTVPSNGMDTEVDQSNAPHDPTPNSPDLPALINDLKHKLAAFVHEMRNFFQQEKRAFSPFQLSPMPT